MPRDPTTFDFLLPVKVIVGDDGTEHREPRLKFPGATIVSTPNTLDPALGEMSVTIASEGEVTEKELAAGVQEAKDYADTLVAAGVQLDTTDATPTQIGGTWTIADDSTLTIEAHVVGATDGAGSVRVHHARRTFASQGSTIIDGTQIAVVPTETLGAALATAVSITRTGPVARIDVTGAAATNVRWTSRPVASRLALVAAPPVVDIDGMVFAGSQSYYGPNTASAALGTARVRFRVDTPPASGFGIIAGTSTGSSGGWLVCWEDTYTGSDVTQLTIYAGISGVLTRTGRKFFMPSDVGRVFTVHIVCDGATAFVYIDGRKIGPGVAATSIDSTSNRMNLGGTSSGTYSSSCTVIDVAEGTTALTPAEVLTDAALDAPGFAGQTHRWTMSTTPGATWEDEVGAYDLTRYGSPASETFTPAYGRHRRSLEVWGDSIAAGRQADTSIGNGWSRAMQRELPASYGVTTTWIGKSPKGATATRDFDLYTSATGGESLNDRLATLASDLATYAPGDCATMLAYGINDIVALDRTAAQLTTDVATAVGLIATARPGAPIFVCSVLDIGTAVSTSGERAEVATYQSGFASMISTLQATYPQVVGIDYTAAVTDPDDTAQLYDGTHPTPDTYAAMAAIIAPIVAGAI